MVSIRLLSINDSGRLTKGSTVQLHHVRVHKSDENLAREDQLAWKIAEVAADPALVSEEVTEMVINRVIDNASVAAASLTRRPVIAARSQALAHPRSNGGDGATVFGLAPAIRRSCLPSPSKCLCIQRVVEVLHITQLCGIGSLLCIQKPQCWG